MRTHLPRKYIQVRMEQLQNYPFPKSQRDSENILGKMISLKIIIFHD